MSWPWDGIASNARSGSAVCTEDERVDLCNRGCAALRAGCLCEGPLREDARGESHDHCKRKAAGGRYRHGHPDRHVDRHGQPDGKAGYEVPIEDGTIRATELRNIKTHDDDFGLMTYDPAYMATASCRSAVTYVDAIGVASSTEAVRSSGWSSARSYLEVAYLRSRRLPIGSGWRSWTT